MQEAPHTYREDSNEPDTWRCWSCERNITDDTKLLTRRVFTISTVTEVLVCDDCVQEFDQDN